MAALRKKEIIELDQLEVGNIQARLKKLIGSAKGPTDSKSIDKVFLNEQRKGRSST